MRIRTIVLTGLLALGVIAPATVAQADVCYDVDVNLNGSSVLQEADCLPL